MKQITAYLFFIFLLPYMSLAQGENNIWPLNLWKMLDFNYNPPLHTDIDTYLYSEAPITAVCNSNGELLFYSGGTRVFDKNFQTMPNGNGLMTDNYFTDMPVLTVPVIGEEGKYYLFTLDAGFNIAGDYIPGELRYSIIDMGLNNGNGDIIEGQKNKLLQGNLTGRLVTAQGLCGSVWLLTHEVNTNRFLAFEITEAGINSPVVSEIGSNLEALIWDIISYKGGMMWFSPNYEKLALFGGHDKFVEIFDFNRFTGEVSSPISLPVEGNTHAVVSGCFSPDNERLYLIETYIMNNNSTEFVNYFQFDLASDDSIIIQNSKILIATTHLGSFHSTQMQLGPDNILYISEYNNIAAIFAPNESGSDVDYRASVFVYSGSGNGNYSFTNPTVFPNNIYVHPMDILPADQSLCSSSSFTIDLTDQGDSFLWQDGSSSPIYQIESPGTYWVDVENGACTFTDTIVVSPLTFDVEVDIMQVSSAGESDGTIVLGQISGGTAPYVLDWSNGASGYELQDLDMGSYSVTITDAQGCIDVQSFTLDLETAIETSAASQTKFWVSPNPSEGELHVHFSKKRTQNLELKIIDISGRFIKNIILSPSQSYLDVSEMSAGFYIIQASIEKENWRSSFIKI